MGTLIDYGYRRTTPLLEPRAEAMALLIAGRPADGAQQRPQRRREHRLQLLVEGVIGNDALQRSYATISSQAGVRYSCKDERATLAVLCLAFVGS